MEYTKDIILDLRCKRKMRLNKLEEWTINIKNIIVNNKFIVITMTSLLILTIIDIALVNSFIKLLTSL